MLGNDVDLGTLGESWLGAARGAHRVVGIFVGTGIGGGIVEDGQLVRGARMAAGEIGHTVICLDGPQCTCGARGCLEALAGRWAIERDIRAAVESGRRFAVPSEPSVMICPVRAPASARTSEGHAAPPRQRSRGGRTGRTVRGKAAPASRSPADHAGVPVSGACNSTYRR